MNFTSRITLIFILLSTCTILPNFAPKANNVTGYNSHNNTAFSEIIEKNADLVQRQLESLHTTLSDLSLIINENQFKTRKDKKVVLLLLQDIMRSIESKKNILTVGANQRTIEYALKFAQAITKHIINGITTQFKNFRSFDEEALLKTKSHGEMTDFDFQLAFLECDAQLEKLCKATNNAGLLWYNKAYRNLNKYFLTYAIDYGPLATAILSGSGYLYWHLVQDSSISQVLGTPYTPDFSKAFIRPAGTTATKLGRIEEFCAHYSAGLPLGAALWYLCSEQIKVRWQLCQEWTTKQIRSIHYRLLGGSYVAKADKIDNIGKEVLFSDLIGLNYPKQVCKSIIEYMRDPESYIRRGQLIGHILFAGPPRTGKTELAKALHYEIKKMNLHKFKFIPLPASWINMHGIDNWLNFVKYQAPCIVFIDEIDMLNVQRSGKNETLSALLQGMSGLDNDSDPTKQVIIIAATNKPECIDSALRTHGRFGKVIHFEYPNYQEREEYLKQQMKKLSLNPQQFNIHKIVSQTERQSYEGLKTLIDHAILKARLDGQSLAQTYFEQALDEALRHVVTTPLKKLPSYEEKILATHFAGHALAATMLNPRTSLAKVTINPVTVHLKEELIGKELWQGAIGKNKKSAKEQQRYEYGKFFMHHAYDSVNVSNQEDIIVLCKIHLAGIAAEKLLLGGCGYSCDCHDKEEALNLLKPLVFEGLDIDTLPKSIQTAKYNELLKLLSTYEQEVSELLHEHQNALENIIIELQEQKTLDASEIAEIIHDSESSLEY